MIPARGGRGGSGAGDAAPVSLAIGGVPEHFNLPWLELIESGAAREAGVDAAWRDFPDGTGAMAAALDGGALDVAMLLTEGAVAAIARGGAIRIVSLYTLTPLLWGIHVPAKSRFSSVDELENARYAISRAGSGSHLMAFVHARERGWPTAGLRFETVGGLDGAVAAFEAGRADVFLWEKFMTQPLVDAGRFRRLGVLASPWPAFVVCASLDALERKRTAVAATLSLALERAARLSRSDAAADEIARRYGLGRDAAREWLSITQWASAPTPADAAAGAALELLGEIGVVAPDPRPPLTAKL